MFEKPLIAIDLVGALEDGWSAKREWLMANGYQFRVEPMMRSDIEPITGHEEYVRMKREVYSPEGILRHGVIDGSLESIATLSEWCQIAIVSARSPRLLQPTIEWLERAGFQPFVTTVALLGGEPRQQSETKVAWCEQ